MQILQNMTSFNQSFISCKLPRTPVHATCSSASTSPSYEASIKSSVLLDSIQPRTVHSNLIIHLIRLPNNDINVFILRINLLAHRSTKVIKTLSRTMEGIYAPMSIVLELEIK